MRLKRLLTAATVLLLSVVGLARFDDCPGDLSVTFLGACPDCPVEYDITYTGNAFANCRGCSAQVSWTVTDVADPANPVTIETGSGRASTKCCSSKWVGTIQCPCTGTDWIGMSLECQSCQ